LPTTSRHRGTNALGRSLLVGFLDKGKVGVIKP